MPSGTEKAVQVEVAGGEQMGGDGGCSWRGTEQSGRGRYLGSRGGRRLLPGLRRSGCWSTPRGCALAARKDREGMETRTPVARAAKSVQRTDGRSCCRASRPAHQDEPRWCGDVARAPRSLRPSPGGEGWRPEPSGSWAAAAAPWMRWALRSLGLQKALCWEGGPSPGWSPGRLGGDGF